jgi:hypothetical protein
MEKGCVEAPRADSGGTQFLLVFSVPCDGRGFVPSIPVDRIRSGFEGETAQDIEAPTGSQNQARAEA